MYHLRSVLLSISPIILWIFSITITAIPTPEAIRQDLVDRSNRTERRALQPTARLTAEAHPILKLEKRDSVSNLSPDLRTFALEHGWSITVSSISVLYPLTSGAVRNVRATQILGALFTQVQAMCAARMLNNSPYEPKFTFRFGKTELDFEVRPRRPITAYPSSINTSFPPISFFSATSFRIHAQPRTMTADTKVSLDASEFPDPRSLLVLHVQLRRIHAGLGRKRFCRFVYTRTTLPPRINGHECDVPGMACYPSVVSHFAQNHAARY